MLNKLDQTLFYQQQALSLRAHRQQVLAGNIANADTPHYRALDFDFSTALRNAVAGREVDSLAMTTSSPGHLSNAGLSAPVRLSYRQAGLPSADDNTVEMDTERAQFAENAVHYEAGLTFISGQIKTLLAALQGS